MLLYFVYSRAKIQINASWIQIPLFFVVSTKTILITMFRDIDKRKTILPFLPSTKVIIINQLKNVVNTKDFLKTDSHGEASCFAVSRNPVT